MKHALDITGSTSLPCRATSTRQRRLTGSIPEFQVRTLADCRASDSVAISFPASADSSGQSFRGRTASPNSSITFPTLQGNHSLKFGGEVHRDNVTGGAWGNARGSITFLGGNTPDPKNPANFLNTTTLEDFFSGAPFKASVLTGNPTFQLHNWAYAAFIQDDWRVTRNVTLNFGLRYEFSGVPQEANNLLGNFDPNLGMVQVGKQISSAYNSDHKNFAPRAGFAWDINGKGTTVVRAGGGLVYETINWESFLAFNNSFGLSSVPTGAIIDAAGDTAGGTINTGNLTVFPSFPWDNGPIYGNLNQKINCFNSPCAIMSVDRNLTTPYVWNWTLSVQHAFTPTLSLEMAYVGNDGGNLMGIRDINQPPVGSGWPASSYRWLRHCRLRRLRL